MKAKTLIVALALSAVALCSCGQQPTTEAETQEAPAQTEQETQGTPKAESPSNDGYSMYNIVSFEWEDNGIDPYGFRSFDIKMTNNGDFAVTLVSPVVCFVDEDGNTLSETYPQLQSNLQPGTYAMEEALVSGDDYDVSQISDIIIDNYQYYTVGLEKDLYIDVNTVAEKADVYEVDS